MCVNSFLKNFNATTDQEDTSLLSITLKIIWYHYHNCSCNSYCLLFVVSSSTSAAVILLLLLILSSSWILFLNFIFMGTETVIKCFLIFKKIQEETQANTLLLRRSLILWCVCLLLMKLTEMYFSFFLFLFQGEIKK